MFIPFLCFLLQNYRHKAYQLKIFQNIFNYYEGILLKTHFDLNKGLYPEKPDTFGQSQSKVTQILLVTDIFTICCRSILVSIVAAHYPNEMQPSIMEARTG